MREKLIELLWAAGRAAMNSEQNKPEAMADHLLANGVIVLPCKVGDTVWFVDYEEIRPVEVVAVRPFISERTREFRINVKVTKIDPFYRDGRTTTIVISADIGKTVFLTREEAEAALRERGEENA